MCHRVKPGDALFAHLPNEANTAAEALKDLPNLFIRMPDLKLSDGERAALVEWVNSQRSAKNSVSGMQGGN
jgi:hypothetical protein